MRIVIRLEDNEGTDCDYAVLDITCELLYSLEKLGCTLLATRVLLPELYKLDLWGNDTKFYPQTLRNAMEALDPLPEDQSDDWDVCLLPPHFEEIPSSCPEARLECQLTEAFPPADCSNVEEVCFQFSAVPKHTSATVRTVAVTLASLREWYASQHAP